MHQSIQQGSGHCQANRCIHFHIMNSQERGFQCAFAPPQISTLLRSRIFRRKRRLVKWEEAGVLSGANSVFSEGMAYIEVRIMQDPEMCG